MGRYQSREIENPEAYNAAIQRRIEQNARTTRRRKLEAAIVADGPAFRAWLLDLTPPHLEPLRQAADALWNEGFGEGTEAYETADRAWQKAQQEYHRLVKHVPQFIRDSLNQWGGLTDGQLAFARRNFAEQTTRRAELEAREAERRATATPWTAGRQSVTGTFVSVKTDSNDFGVSYKALVEVEGGRKLWTTIPRFILDTLGAEIAPGQYKQFGDLKGETHTITVTVQPKDDDPTFAFGSRPTAPKVTK